MCNCTSAAKISFLSISLSALSFKASTLSLVLIALEQRSGKKREISLELCVGCATFRYSIFRRLAVAIITVNCSQEWEMQSFNSPSRAHESMDCMLTGRHDAPSSFGHRKPMWHRQSLHRRADSRTLMLCCSDNCSISDKSAECPPSCWCECCCCFPENEQKKNTI